MEFGGGWPLYYSVLGVSTDASDEEIRRAYRKLAMQWHPDKWAKDPSFLVKAKQKFQQIQEAYSVLSDRNKRMMYNSGLYDRHDDEEETEGFADFLEEMMSLMNDFLEEMMSLMNDVREEKKNYSFGELQSMFWEMAQDFDNSMQQPTYNSQWVCGQSSMLYESGNSASIRQENPQWSKSSFESFGFQHFCV